MNIILLSSLRATDYGIVKTRLDNEYYVPVAAVGVVKANVFFLPVTAKIIEASLQDFDTPSEAKLNRLVLSNYNL